MLYFSPNQKNPLKWNTSLHKLYHPRYATKIYLCVNTCYCLVIECFGWLLSIVGVLLMALNLLSLYTLIGFKNAAVRILFCTVFMNIQTFLHLFSLLGEVYVRSNNLIKAWNVDYIGTCEFKSKRWQFEKRRLKAFRPLKFLAGTCWFVGEMVSPKIFNTVVDKTVLALTAFPWNQAEW